MKKRFIIVLAMLCPALSNYAQAPPQIIRPLTIGDTVPDILLSNIINYPVSKIQLSDLKGKLLILDFWATWCSACIMAFPKMQEMEKAFPAQLMVMGVTTQDEKKISAFFNSTNGKAHPIPTIVGDRLLNSLFPHKGVPHFVWLDDKRVVRAITDLDDVNRDNVKAMLLGNHNFMQVKKDMDTKRPLYLSLDYPTDNELLYYSLLTKGHYSGLPSGTQFRRKGDTIMGRAIYNSDILNIYESLMWPLFEKIGDAYCRKKMQLEISDASKVMMTKGDYGFYRTDNDYSFEFLLPASKADSLYPYMLRDLNRYTAYHGSIEKRKTTCLVLERIAGIDKIKTKGGANENSLFYKTPARLSNYPISYLVMDLNACEAIPYPVVDLTDYRQHVDIELTGCNSLEQVNRDLNKYNLRLSTQEREINLFVLRETEK